MAASHSLSLRERKRDRMAKRFGSGALEPVLEMGKNAKAYLVCFFLRKLNEQG